MGADRGDHSVYPRPRPGIIALGGVRSSLQRINPRGGGALDRPARNGPALEAKEPVVAGTNHRCGARRCTRQRSLSRRRPRLLCPRHVARGDGGRRLAMQISK